MYIYILARHLLPNLGVHTSEKAAHAHLDACIADRKRQGMKVFHDTMLQPSYSGDSIRRVVVASEEPGSADETFYIERWSIRRRLNG
jgi:hypothetical protein